MTAPDHQGYTVPGETDDPFEIYAASYYGEATEPNPPCTDMEEAKRITRHHIREFVENDTEDPDVRIGCLRADLGFKPNEHGLSVLIDTYRPTALPLYHERWEAELETYLAGHGVERP